ncbi:MAG: hypothetical protein R3Y06_07350 [Faecalibacterium sp.]
MVLTVKRAFFKHTIYDENGTELLHIRHKGNHYKVEDVDNTPLLEVGEEGEQQLVFNGEHLHGHADIKLKESKNAFLLPRAEQVDLQVEQDTYHITQSDKRTFPILCNGEPVVYISSVLARTIQMELKARMDKALVALLFVSSMIMLHEDDEILV